MFSGSGIEPPPPPVVEVTIGTWIMILFSENVTLHAPVPVIVRSKLTRSLCFSPKAANELGTWLTKSDLSEAIG